MGFYIRKSFRAGPIRLNLSKSGLGVSEGVTGARVGVGPRGTYVHVGRGGLYYRKNLGGGSKSSASTGSHEAAVSTSSSVEEFVDTGVTYPSVIQKKSYIDDLPKTPQKKNTDAALVGSVLFFGSRSVAGQGEYGS